MKTATPMQLARSIPKIQIRKPLKFGPVKKDRLGVTMQFLKGHLTLSQTAKGLQISESCFHYRIFRLLRNAARNKQLCVK